MPRPIWMLLAAGLAFMAAPAAAQNGVGGSLDVEEVTATEDKGDFIYSAKFVCGTASPDGVGWSP